MTEARRALFWVFVVAAMLSGLAGCSTLLTDAIIGINATHDAIAEMHSALEEWHRAERDAAIASSHDEAEAREKTEAVHARFRPVWARYDKARAAWLAARAAVAAGELAEAAGDDPDAAQILAAIRAAAAAWNELRAAVEALGGPALPILPDLPAVGPSARDVLGGRVEL